ncbi:TPA: thioredoxin family protein [Bacillus cereus]|uniref:thioredoxin family protein n=1 Tax=Bacillus cereus group TaxID=86661 RepID=UPI000A376328|nr:MULTISPECIES: thioredoxin family protein [Bacillus cereus group]MDA2411818.1 thioredoxin family protein [Bacillus cereus]OUA54801.1 thiol reductase thioredoxin [Bacillus thuringiensis serovar bolivia]OUA78514.1 thiol reductase thioredoxin [Bacillus thuringiensis serovar pahangi]QUW37875.1 thioredoxin family protein [Bacillus cereus]UDV83105.1 thioredoxin family protein [Bacillus cereus]
MKKMLIFGGIIIALFAAIFAVTQMEEKNASTSQKIDNATGSQTDGPDYYKNKISLSDLQKNLKEKKEETVYFYQTSCVHCQKLSPVVVPMAKDLNVDMKVMDIEKLDVPWDEYKIQGTPTIIHFKDGKEVSRISGEQPKDKLKEWLEQTKK